MQIRNRLVQKEIRFYFDFLSPYAYLARHRLIELSTKNGWKIDYRSIDLGQAKKAIGNIGPANRDMPVKLEYLKNDLLRWAALYGIPLEFPANYNSSRLNIGLYYESCKGRESDYVRKAFDHVWGLGEAPDSPQTLDAIARQMGWDSDEFAEFTDSETGLQMYRETTNEAVSKKVFGVPTMIAGEEMWWGDDRLFLVEEYLNQEK